MHRADVAGGTQTEMVGVLVVGGLVALLAGGELLVASAAILARRLGVSPLVIGLTVVGFGTSTPELVTCVLAALEGAPGLVIGNVVGSNIANVLLVVGLAMLACPTVLGRGDFRRDAWALSLATAFGIALAFVGIVNRLAGAALVIALVAYLFVIHLGERAQSGGGAHGVGGDCAVDAEHAEGSAAGGSLARALAGVIVGLLLTVFGARWLVDGAVEVATRLAVSETIIGLTLVAIGTSLPELATSVIAARRGHAELAFGNVVGSNVYNLLGILGVTALVEPVRIPAEIVGMDVWVMTASTAWLIAVGLSRRRVGRIEGGVLLAAYLAYVVHLVL